MAKETLQPDLQGKKILVFGASSKLAGEFVTRAVSRGAEVYAVARTTSKVPQAPVIEGEDLGETASRLHVIQYNATDRSSVFAAHEAATRDGIRPDVSINLAADFSFSPKASEQAVDINVNGEEFVLRAGEEFEVKKHIFTSTIGTQIEGPTSYKDTKLAAEAKVQESSIPELFIARLGNTLRSPDKGDMWNSPVKTVAIDFNGKRLHIPSIHFTVFSFNKFPAKRDYRFPFVDIDTVEDALLAMTVIPGDTKGNVVPVNIVDGETTIERYLDVTGKVNDIKRYVRIPTSFFVHGVRAYNALVGDRSRISNGAVQFAINPPVFDPSHMTERLGVKPQSFDEVEQKMLGIIPSRD